MDKKDWLAHVRVLYHSTVRLSGERIVYTDPYDLAEAPHDADVILITHDHYDHFSPANLEKVKKPATILAVPESMAEAALAAGFAAAQVVLVKPGVHYAIGGVAVETVPAYNVGKDFHPQAQHWVGYIVQMNGLRYYIAGDTDGNADVQQVRCDVALLPVGGTYTMTAAEAADLAQTIHPQAAVPTHYGAIVGEKADGERFCQLLPPEIAGAVLMERFAQ